ncbi:hypothetical protein [Rhizobium sp. C4]|uniref:hypothetical protein n=1 Tax=Rhizobium sp. C4 TaxID=1349800 RepID=UPI001E4A53B6|nr:hypothetical protein [Rhizobium sp. C4]MCD2175717.1 hypothetical protein [Rhizobium sp. C4]
MQNLLMMVLLSVVAYALITGLFVFLGMRWNALIAGAVLYLLFGGFVAMAQFAGAGACPSWRTDGVLIPVLAWPGDFYVNVVTGDITARRYLIPRTCELRVSMVR